MAYVYYTNNKIFETPGFRKIISQNKLVFIEKYIHFIDISELGESYNRSSKVHPIHKYIIERWQSLLILGRGISIDEALLLWKGRLSWKQFIRTKWKHSFLLMLARTRLFKRGRYNDKTRFKLYLSCYYYCDDSSKRCI